VLHVLTVDVQSKPKFDYFGTCGITQILPLVSTFVGTLVKKKQVTLREKISDNYQELKRNKNRLIQLNNVLGCEL